jgi:hypothetical protein
MKRHVISFALGVVRRLTLSGQTWGASLSQAFEDEDGVNEGIFLGIDQGDADVF